MLQDTVRTEFEKRFKRQPTHIVLSPGRINLMGEHTDYNLGFVLPAAIGYYMCLAIAPNGTEECNVFSLDYNEAESFSINRDLPTSKKWLNYIIGVTSQLSDKIGGYDLVFNGNVPEGSGLSSSAALSCGTGYAISYAFSLNVAKWDLARIAQKTEHDFINVKCGIMDQFACLFGLTNHALLLNCATLEYEEISFDLSGYKFLLLNSNVPHELNESEYNDRREESQIAINYLIQRFDSVSNYQDVNARMLKESANEMDSTNWKRAYHITKENQRVHDLSRALKLRNFEEAGNILNQGHDSEKDFYEITCNETDYLVDKLNKYDSILGARQVGGGFGGCVLALAKDKDLDTLLEEVNKDYKKKFGLKTTHIPVNISKGCHLVD